MNVERVFIIFVCTGRQCVYTIHGPRYTIRYSKCWPIVTDDGGSVDTLHYKLGVSDFKCEDCCPDSNHTLSSTSLTQWEARALHD